MEGNAGPCPSAEGKTLTPQFVHDPSAEPQAFRDAMSRVAGAVHLIATAGPGGKGGLTATAVTSVSDAPPTLLVCLNKSSRTAAIVRETGAFSGNTLGAGQQELANVFAARNVRPALDDEQLFPTQIELALVYDDYRTRSQGGFGEVTRYTRDASGIRITLKTDEATVESLRFEPGDKILLNGEEMKESGWREIEDKAGKLKAGMRAIAWICRGGRPVLDWRPPQR
jgi:hypothetical protein